MLAGPRVQRRLFALTFAPQPRLLWPLIATAALSLTRVWVCASYCGWAEPARTTGDGQQTCNPQLENLLQRPDLQDLALRARSVFVFLAAGDEAPDVVLSPA